jgi:DNA-binding NarL/FixJ family response regulator
MTGNRFSDDASAPQSDEKRPAIIRPRVPISDLGLTERQLDVLALMMQGKSNKAICRVLNLAEPTVKNYVTAILRALVGLLRHPATPKDQLKTFIAFRR